MFMFRIEVAEPAEGVANLSPQVANGSPEIPADWRAGRGRDACSGKTSCYYVCVCVCDRMCVMRRGRGAGVGS